MSRFKFYQPIDVRYGDLDPQGHVNNARFVTYLEHARVGYVRYLELWEGDSYQDLGFILAHLAVDYQAPILITDRVQVGVRVTYLGGKSLDMVYRMEDAEVGRVFAEARTVLVSYDYHTGETVTLPPSWRKVIAEFENIPLKSDRSET